MEVGAVAVGQQSHSRLRILPLLCSFSVKSAAAAGSDCDGGEIGLALVVFLGPVKYAKADAVVDVVAAAVRKNWGSIDAARFVGPFDRPLGATCNCCARPVDCCCSISDVVEDVAFGNSGVVLGLGVGLPRVCTRLAKVRPDRRRLNLTTAAAQVLPQKLSVHNDRDSHKPVPLSSRMRICKSADVSAHSCANRASEKF